MHLLLSSSNIMGGGRSVLRRGPAEKSNAELVTSLRSNFAAAEPMTNGDGPSHTRSYQSWTRQEGSKLFIPANDFNHGLVEDREQYDITVKLFYLPGILPSNRCAHTREAIDLVLRELHVKSIDLLIVSFPGISFDADDEDVSDDESDELASRSPPGTSTGNDDDTACNDGDIPPEDIETTAKTWTTLESLHSSGVIRCLGVAEFGSHRLRRLFGKVKTRPSVDQINVRDCCVVPKQLILFAKQEGIELLTHNDCTNILPGGTIRELLGSGATGAGVLASSGTGVHTNGEETKGLSGDVVPQWVVKYTAVIKNRGVIENKGYFAAAELNQGG